MFTATEKRRCAEREVALRRNVYRRKIIGGKMTPNAANREIAIMQAIAEDYAALERETA